MGIRSSRCVVRDGPDVQEPERPSSKVLGSENSVETDNEHVPVVGLMSQSHWQQMNSQDIGPLELQERTVDQGLRILSRTRHVNIAPLARFCLRNNERLTEPVHFHHTIDEADMQTRSEEQERSSSVRGFSNMINNMPAITNRNIGSPVQTLEQSFTSGASLQDTESYSFHSARNSHRVAATVLPNDDRSNTNSRTEGSSTETGRNSFWDTLTYTVSQRHNSNEDFREDGEPVLLMYNSRARLSTRRSERNNATHIDREYRRSRSLSFEERRRRFRSQVWALQQLNTRFEAMPLHTRPYSIGRNEAADQFQGSAVSHEETTTRASISRILMLAEALFQVLEDIHRQSVTLPRSTGLSLGYLPTPLAVIEAIPLKVFRKGDTYDDKDEALLQCHICLMEYEEGDQMRVLPCNHEYHMICVDKWLREVHRVCPLCRRDVCEFRSHGST